ILQTANKHYHDKNVKVISRDEELISSHKPKLILLSTTVFGNVKYSGLSSKQIFGVTCPYESSCIWSCNRREHFSTADAIIFHAYDVQYFHESVPDRREVKKNTVFVLWSDEPATIIDYKLFNKYYFNWTISYKLESEVSVASYGLYSIVKEKSDEIDQWIYNQFRQRQTSALWFVSNCDANERLKLYHQLKRLFPIEGYGRCVDYYPIHLCTSKTPCETRYMMEYKYYLSFESNTCSGYVSEKFWKALSFGLIPIVYGPKKEDYIRIAPPSSFIHVDDFDTVSALSEHLFQVGNNYTL
ncbi:unnamed protein product, partial [Didymodactylos carnosus]